MFIVTSTYVERIIESMKFAWGTMFVEIKWNFS